eukprot:s424_g18.t3
MASRLAVCVRPWPAGRLPLARVSHGQCRQVAWPYMVQMRGALSSSADSEVTTDATFRYSSFSWRTSAGERYPYEYIVAQQPAGGGTARNALVALEESLPGPASGWSMVLLPSVSLVCSGKEEMRPLATLLSQRGHRCYILEWPGWTQHVQTNWALERCKTEHLAEEYQDFWCQALEHVAQRELAEAKSEAKARKLCIVAAGSASVYALRAVKALQDFVQKEKSQAIPELRYDSLVMLAPSWRAERRQGLLSRLSPDRAAYWMGEGEGCAAARSHGQSECREALAAWRAARLRNYHEGPERSLLMANLNRILTATERIFRSFLPGFAVQAALHLVCEELRRTHKCNKHLEERQSDLAAELDELKPRSVQLTRLGGAVKVNNRPERIELTNHPAPLQTSHLAAVIPARHLAAAPAAAPAAPAAPAAAAAAVAPAAASSARSSVAPTSAPDGSERRQSEESKAKNRASSDRSSMASSRRVTLKLSRSILKKLSANAGHSQKEEGSDSGSEIFEANNPEEVQEMQRILDRLSWKYEYMPEGNEAGQEDADVKPAREEDCVPIACHPSASH